MRIQLWKSRNPPFHTTICRVASWAMLQPFGLQTCHILVLLAGKTCRLTADLCFRSHGITFCDICPVGCGLRTSAFLRSGNPAPPPEEKIEAEGKISPHPTPHFCQSDPHQPTNPLPPIPSDPIPSHPTSFTQAQFGYSCTSM